MGLVWANIARKNQRDEYIERKIHKDNLSQEEIELIKIKAFEHFPSLPITKGETSESFVRAWAQTTAETLRRARESTNWSTWQLKQFWKIAYANYPEQFTLPEELSGGHPQKDAAVILFPDSKSS